MSTARGIHVEDVDTVIHFDLAGDHKDDGHVRVERHVPVSPVPSSPS
jgi:superfamily II DNA/RNA helicase